MICLCHQIHIWNHQIRHAWNLHFENFHPGNAGRPISILQVHIKQTKISPMDIIEIEKKYEKIVNSYKI